jgi:hypothetical protein
MKRALLKYNGVLRWLSHLGAQLSSTLVDLPQRCLRTVDLSRLSRYHIDSVFNHYRSPDGRRAIRIACSIEDHRAIRDVRDDLVDRSDQLGRKHNHDHLNSLDRVGLGTVSTIDTMGYYTNL